MNEELEIIKKENKINKKIESEYYQIVRKLVKNEKILEMKKYPHHGKYTCFEHCLNVSYMSYLICKFFDIDYIAAARGGLLHDFFLYDWHLRENLPFFEKHGFTHSDESLKNSQKYFKISELEKDIIKKHMWPVNIDLPKYKETWVVILSDKICCVLECLKSIKIKSRS